MPKSKRKSTKSKGETTGEHVREEFKYFSKNETTKIKTAKSRNETSLNVQTIETSSTVVQNTEVETENTVTKTTITKKRKEKKSIVIESQHSTTIDKNVFQKKSEQDGNMDEKPCDLTKCVQNVKQQLDDDSLSDVSDFSELEQEIKSSKKPKKSNRIPNLVTKNQLKKNPLKNSLNIKLKKENLNIVSPDDYANKKNEKKNNNTYNWASEETCNKKLKRKNPEGLNVFDHIQGKTKRLLGNAIAPKAKRLKTNGRTIKTTATMIQQSSDDGWQNVVDKGNSSGDYKMKSLHEKITSHESNYIKKEINSGNVLETTKLKTNVKTNKMKMERKLMSRIPKIDPRAEDSTASNILSSRKKYNHENTTTGNKKYTHPYSGGPKTAMKAVATASSASNSLPGMVAPSTAPLTNQKHRRTVDGTGRKVSILKRSSRKRLKKRNKGKRRTVHRRSPRKRSGSHSRSPTLSRKKKKRKISKKINNENKNGNNGCPKNNNTSSEKKASFTTTSSSSNLIKIKKRHDKNKNKQRSDKNNHNRHVTQNNRTSSSSGGNNRRKKHHDKNNKNKNGNHNNNSIIKNNGKNNNNNNNNGVHNKNNNNNNNSEKNELQTTTSPIHPPPAGRADYYNNNTHHWNQGYHHTDVMHSADYYSPMNGHPSPYNTISTPSHQYYAQPDMMHHYPSPYHPEHSNPGLYHHPGVAESAMHSPYYMPSHEQQPIAHGYDTMNSTSNESKNNSKFFGSGDDDEVVPEWFAHSQRFPMKELERDFLPSCIATNDSVRTPFCGVSYLYDDFKDVIYRPPLYLDDFKGCQEIPVSTFFSNVLAQHYADFDDMDAAKTFMNEYIRYYDDREHLAEQNGAKVIDKEKFDFEQYLNLLLQKPGFLIFHFKLDDDGNLRPQFEDVYGSDLQLVLAYDGNEIEAEFWIEPQLWVSFVRENSNICHKLLVSAYKLGKTIKNFTENYPEKKVDVKTSRDGRLIARYDVRPRYSTLEIEKRKIETSNFKFDERVRAYEKYMDVLDNDFELNSLHKATRSGSIGVMCYDDVFDEKELQWLESRVNSLIEQNPEEFHFTNQTLKDEKFLSLLEGHLVHCEIIEDDFINHFDILTDKEIRQLMDCRSQFSRPIISVQLFDGCRLVCKEDKQTESAICVIPLHRGTVCVLLRDSFVADACEHYLQPMKKDSRFCNIYLRKKHET